MGAEEVADRLAAIGEELSELAFDRLLEAAGAAGRGSAPDPAVVADERRLTRARRAVEKAVAVLRAPGPGASDADGVS